MKPLQHAQISAKTYGGGWQDYVEIHSFLDSSKVTCAHFKHRFLLHHREGVELGVKIFGESLTNSAGKEVETRRLLTDHLIEDVGRIVGVEDWARDLLPAKNDGFYRSLVKKRGQIETNTVAGENELLAAFGLTQEDVNRTKNLLQFPLVYSSHPAALLVSHNSFAVFLAEKLFEHAFVKATSRTSGDDSKLALVAVREVFERVIFGRLRVVLSPAEIIARTASQEWMRGAESSNAQAEKKRLATGAMAD